MPVQPWQRFRVGRPGTAANDCRSLTTVSHVAHLSTALRVVEDGRLRADLVFDKSKLNKRRIRVVWLSPNDWSNAGGFRYGNVRFTFDWNSLISGKQCYWVESMDYTPEAPRILITDVDRSQTLEPYDPCAGDGPWWHAPDGEHYWNGNYTLEVMFEMDVPLTDAKEVDFVRHHPRRCNVDWKTCAFAGVSGDLAGCRFLAALTARMASAKVPGLVAADGSPESALEGAMSATFLALRKATKGCTWGKVKRTSRRAPALARATLGALSNPAFEADVAVLARQFASEDDLQGAVADAVAALLGTDDGDALLGT